MQPTTEEILGTLPDQLPVGIWVARAPGGEFVYANRAFQEIMGMGARDDVAVGEYAAPYGIHDREGHLYSEAKMPFVRALTEAREVVIDDIVIHRPDGGRAYIRATAKPIFEGPTITHVVIAFIDISREVLAERARAQSEARVRQAERMESIGNLASGVAHDFNNLLAVIKAIAATLLHSEPDGAKRDGLRTIDETTDSAAALTRALLGFSGRSRRGSAPIDVSATLRRVGGLLQRTIDRRVVLEVQADSQLAVLGEESDLEQVLMNLVINAREAMPAGGQLRLRSFDVEATVVLEVTDSGEGIPAGLRERVFEPYFTTKDAGPRRGTGLGLATVHGLVRLYGGTIEVLPNAPNGTTMRVSFPGVPRPAPTAPELARGRVPSGSGLLMVVDDEPSVNRATSQLLRMVGFEVIQAAGGAEAIELYKVHGPKIRAVLLDLSMPKMNGEATFVALRALDPDVRVVLTTGYALDGREKTLRELGIKSLLLKPFGLEQLIRSLEAAMRNSPPG